MLLPASGPKSSCTALNLRFSEENWLRTPWADSRTVGLTDSSIAASNIHGPTVRPSDRPTRLVESLNGRSREISSEDLAILLSRARPADRAPLTQPQAVTSARSEEHTSELQSQSNLVCRLLLEKKKKKIHKSHVTMSDNRYRQSLQRFPY